jgi:glycosyltransferase involved in cell wall biosynthesis
MPPGLEIGPLASKDSSRELLGLPHGNLICSYIGRVTQIKRPDRFLDVVNICVDRKLPIDFSIAGDGELLDECRQRITNELLPVTVLGWQSDIERVLSASDIVILTSDNEGTPLSLIQAGMTGLPVVTTNVGSIPEVVLNGQTGLITDLEIIHIADALELLVTDGVLRNRLGSAAREFTLSKFGVKRLVSEHENLYLKLLEHSK